MTAILQKVSEWASHVWSTSGSSTPEKVGPYKADYSRLEKGQLEQDDFECTELFKNSRPVSR
ncbi:hypothetical protein GPL21_33150 [Bradyrhizobium pachyrhizi]|uniref:Uncharacterized protein n=1 Tax=Bradyrhizobium pachyrhizi TaxID=280333 RepID=A0A844SUG9_9BRAD|nr:hypothetical protein [Bradyrhizobium pachyrhizi]MVT69937.1 hypothetical protein [Bradyrhizobium pachyrhizi]